MTTDAVGMDELAEAVAERDQQVSEVGWQTSKEQ